MIELLRHYWGKRQCSRGRHKLREVQGTGSYNVGICERCGCMQAMTKGEPFRYVGRVKDGEVPIIDGIPRDRTQTFGGPS